MSAENIKKEVSKLWDGLMSGKINSDEYDEEILKLYDKIKQYSDKPNYSISLSSSKGGFKVDEDNGVALSPNSFKHIYIRINGNWKAFFPMNYLNPESIWKEI